MNISTSSSVPSNLKLAHRSTRSKSPAPSSERISVSTSAGQIICTAADASLPGSHQRLRVGGTPRPLLSRNFQLSDVPENEKNAASPPGTTTPPSSKKFHASIVDNRPWRPLFCLSLWLKYLGISYCFLSVVFLSAIIFRRLQQSASNTLPNTHNPSRSYLSDRSNQELISMACSGIFPPPRAFDPFILGANLATHKSDIYNKTASLWLHDGELDVDLLIAWATLWSGRIAFHAMPY